MGRYGSFTVLVVLTAALAGCDESVNRDVTASGAAASTVNGSVRVPDGEHAGAVGTVNGSVDVGSNAVVGSVHTVNGPIQMGAHASADEVKAVNGEVTVGEGAHVAHDLVTVNGTIDLKGGADVGGTVKNVNGHIVLNGAHVAGGLHTVGGDIDINGDSHVEGGILVRKGDWFSSSSHRPRIVIGPGAVVQGDLRFEREVQLYVSDKATVGPVTGATAIRFSGEKPQA